MRTTRYLIAATDMDLDDIRARHHPGATINRIGPDFGKRQCDYCTRVWPCDAGTLVAEYEELEAIFDLRWKADMLAIKRWQKAHADYPKAELTWPDHADLVIWLFQERMEILTRNRNERDVLRAEINRLNLMLDVATKGSGILGPSIEMNGHPFTCGICSWGRDGAYHGYGEYEEHMAAAHPEA
jgi:hypothetical protein